MTKKSKPAHQIYPHLIKMDSAEVTLGERLWGNSNEQINSPPADERGKFAILAKTVRFPSVLRGQSGKEQNGIWA